MAVIYGGKDTDLSTSYGHVLWFIWLTCRGRVSTKYITSYTFGFRVCKFLARCTTAYGGVKHGVAW